MSFEARCVISRCSAPILAIRHELSQLTDAGLQALVAEIRGGSGHDELPDRWLWNGVASAAENIVALRKAWRANDGQWYAVAIRSRWIPDGRDSAETDVVEWVACDGKVAAVWAARELLEKHANLFGVSITVAVDIHPELEWCPPKPPPTVSP